MVKVNILDCTLRDGGYYNSWRFSSSIVNAYINALTESSVTHIELGFRFAKQDKNLGKFAFTTEEHLNSIDFPGNQQLGVMINGDEYLNSEDPCNLITKYFLPAKSSKISFVRIAIDLVNAPKAKILIDCLDDLGYEVMLNLMQANQQKSDVVEATIAIISKWKNLKVLYFADSL
ncbi:MAG TPA: pyruvate carboxyltransferase, partial [Methylophilaceae bacterium]|nr:pyruvate carboxyltransferase [Methylophilaceae bacterium]